MRGLSYGRYSLVESNRTGPSRRLLAVALTIVVVSAILLAVRHTRTTSKTLEDLRAELTAIRDERPSAPIVLREVRALPHTETVPPEPGPTRIEVATSSNPVSPAEMEKRIKIINETKDDTYSRAHNNEMRDSAWAEAAERSIREKYSGEEFQPLKIAADCRSTLCKIEFSYADPAAGLMAAQRLTTLHPWKTQRFTRVDQESQEGVSYLAREGRKLPSVDLPSF